MKTVQPGFRDMGAGSGRRRRRGRGKEAALTPRRTRGVQTVEAGRGTGPETLRTEEVGRGERETVRFRVEAARLPTPERLTVGPERT